MPSSLKSPVALTCQVGPRIEQAGGACWPGTCKPFHQPDSEGVPVIIIPQDVGLAVAIEGTAFLDVPARPRIERADGTRRKPVPRAVHQPDRRRAVAGLPEDVADAVGIEVGRRGGGKKSAAVRKHGKRAKRG